MAGCLRPGDIGGTEQREASAGNTHFEAWSFKKGIFFFKVGIRLVNLIKM